MPILYKVFISRTAEKQLKAIPAADQRRVASMIWSLAVDPHPIGTKKLSGFHATYRVRVGKYRIIYEIASKEVTVTVLKVGHRREIYRL